MLNPPGNLAVIDVEALSGTVAIGRTREGGRTRERAPQGAASPELLGDNNSHRPVPSKRVVGVDLSLTGTGLATITPDRAPIVSTSRSKILGASLNDRDSRLRGIEHTVLAVCDGAALVVVEGPSYASKGAGTWDRAGLWWYVIRALLATGVPTAEVPPTTLKKFAAGKGNADKTAVAVGLSRLWPDVNASNDNEWDALALATMGAQHLDIPVPQRAHHRDAMAKVVWP
jgi:crossover junction endodeoxyribonuclease RuvC